MSAIPTSYGRIPSMLAMSIRSNNLLDANASMLELQEQLATGLRINRPSDDAIGAALVSVLDHQLARDEQVGRNMNHARTLLDSQDQSLSQLSDLLLEAKTIASSQVGVGSDADSRANQAIVIDSILNEAFSILNREVGGIHYFGGSQTGAAPFESFHGGFRYRGEGEGLFTEIGSELEFPITLGGEEAAGALSARVEGDVDLNPQLTQGTRVRDLRGPAEGNLPLGTLDITIDNGTPVTIQADLSNAETMGDVADAIESAILAQDPAALPGAFPSNVGVAGERLSVAVAPGYTITFGDGVEGSSATALGLDGFAYSTANPTNTNPGTELNPRITDATTLASLAPAGGVAFGDIVFSNGGANGTVTTSGTMTIGELKEAIRQLGIGVRMEIDESGDSINVINEVSGARLSISEGGTTAATSLGIRSLSATTAIEHFNDGRGVEIADGEIDPVTGLPDPDRNVDFEVTLTDGSTFTVDLTPADMATVQTVLDKINADAAAAGFGGVFNATLSTTTNGIVFEDTAGGGGSVSVTSLNGYAAEDLGLLDATFSAGAPATFAAEDRATVRVDSVLTTLIDLRNALESNDERGITFAGGDLEQQLQRVSQAHALVGARGARLDAAQTRLEDRMILDESIRSDLRDLDYVEATSRFALLQTQLQAGYQSAAATSQLTLLNFLA